MSDARRPGPTREQLSELKTLRAYELATEKLVTPRRSAEMSDAVRRFDPKMEACGREAFVEMELHPTGSFVSIVDYDRLRSEVERLKSREITDEQIDEAWWYAHYHPRGEHRDICLELLSKLHIDECPECGGSGVTEHYAGIEFGELTLQCRHCNGHKWIREERGDE
jgi:hypothetical protein